MKVRLYIRNIALQGEGNAKMVHYRSSITITFISNFTLTITIIEKVGLQSITIVEKVGLQSHPGLSMVPSRTY